MLVCGIGIDIFGTAVAATLLALPFTVGLAASGATPEEIAEQLLRNPTFFWVLAAVGSGLTLLAGYVAGRWAGCRPEIHGTAAGITSLVLTLPSFWAAETPVTPAPDWVTQAGLVLHVPLACFGGWLAGRRGH